MACLGYLHHLKWNSLKYLYLRDHQQITFVTLNKFVLFNKTPHSPVRDRQNHVIWNTNHWMGYQPKSYKNSMPFLHCISSFEGSFFKKV